MALLFYQISSSYWFSYFIFFSALIVTIRSDFETFLISRYMTLALIPVGWLCSFTGLLPIGILQSITGTLFGYFILFTVARFFLWASGKEGMGQGDLELIAFIGSFLGIFGCWITLIIASQLGALFGIGTMIVLKQTRDIKIPFGPFLAFGAILFVLFQNFFINFF